MPGGAQVMSTFLVDGFAAGSWSLQDKSRGGEGGGSAARVRQSGGQRRKDFVRSGVRGVFSVGGGL